MKPFINESYNGNKTAMDPNEVAWTVDKDAGVRLALIMYENGMLTEEQFLEVLRPASTIRIRGEYDGDCL